MLACWSFLMIKSIHSQIIIWCWTSCFGDYVLANKLQIIPIQQTPHLYLRMADPMIWVPKIFDNYLKIILLLFNIVWIFQNMWTTYPFSFSQAIFLWNLCGQVCTFSKVSSWFAGLLNIVSCALDVGSDNRQTHWFKVPLGYSEIYCRVNGTKLMDTEA